MPIIRKSERRYNRCKIVSQIVLKYGSIWSDKITDENILEFCEGEYVNLYSLRKDVTPSNIKWYIRDKLEVKDPIWTADFIAGIIKTGKVYWSLSCCPTFKWWGSPILATILESCPYYGKVKNGKLQKEDRHCYCWIKVPALYLRPSCTTISYVAGLLCTGRKHELNGETYISYKPEVMRELNLFGIPQEGNTIGMKKALISPFWPALFTKYMPESCHDYWLNIKKPRRGVDYAAILWATHATHKIVKGGLPYLPSRRTVFYKFSGQNGTIRELQKLRVEYDLLRLDNRVKDCLITWFDNV